MPGFENREAWGSQRRGGSSVGQSPLRWREVAVVAFTVYLDDSGTDPNQPVACATALIIPARRITQMEREWATLKLKEGFSDFHTSIFAARNRKSEFADWDDEKQKRVLRRVRQITKKYGTQVFSLVVKKEDYDGILPLHYRNYLGRHHYSWALRHVASFCQLFRLGHKNVPPYEWVFDWMEKSDPARREVETAMEQAESMARLQRNVEGDYTNVHFRKRATLAALQCVDLIAWTNYQMALREFRKKQPHPLAEATWQDFARMPAKHIPLFPEAIDWNHALTLKPDSLKQWIDKEMHDGIALGAFKEWEEARKRTKSRRVTAPTA